MRRYKYTGKTAGVELRRDRQSYVADQDGVFEVPFEISSCDFEEIVEKPAKPGKEKDQS